MTELKAKGVDDVYLEYFNTGNHDLAKVYLKTEVDHYIAELEEKHKKEVEQLLILNREQANAANRLRDSMEQALRHQKHKRCLAMAKWCDVTALFYGNAIPKVLNIDITDPRRQKVFRRLSHYKKWYKRWLKIAEKFKEAK